MSEDPKKPEKIEDTVASKPDEDASQAAAVDEQEQTPSAAEDNARVNAESAAENAVEENTPPPAQEKKRGGAGLGLLALLLALVALGGNYWLYTQLQSAGSGSKQLAQEVADVEQAVASARAKLEQTGVELQSAQQAGAAELASEMRELIDTRTEDMQRQLRQNREQMYELRQQMQSVSAADKRNWLLAEAEYLMRLASQRLLMSGDVVSAADLLQSADDVLQSLDDSTLTPIRGQIAEEVAALRTAARFDAEGLYLELQGLAKQAGNLTLFEQPELEVAEPELPADASAQQKLEAGVRRAWAKLRSYVVLQKREENYERLIAPEQEASLRYSVRLMFEQAQLALLHGNQALYQRSLTKAADWIETYYVLEGRSELLVARMRELAERPVVRQVPDISASLRSLKLYVEDENARRRAAS